MSESKPYSYFDTPDGEDTFKKLLIMLKPVGLTGIAISTVDVLCRPKNRTYLEILGRYAYFTLPMLGMASAFVITSNLAANYRNKDDKLNWIMGAVAAGSICGAWQKSTPVGVAASTTLVLAAALKKHALQEGWSLIPKKTVCYGGVTSLRYDYTLTKERPRNWTTGK